MTDHNNHTPLTEDDMPNLHEQLECRRVFTRRNIPCPDVEEAWCRFVTRRDITEQENAETTMEMKKEHPSRSLLRWLVAACAIIAVVLTALYWQHSTENDLQVCAATHEPKGITVTDAKGNQQTLASAPKMVFTPSPQSVSNVKVIKTITVKTSRGKDCHIVLPDGSEAWLNAESCLQFPETFTGKTREIQLQGEAYFDVKHDERHPFIVTNQYFSTVVYGTEFNVNARDAATANVILVKGKVAVRDSYQSNKTIMLNPGQQALFAEDGMSVKSVNPYPFVQWKDGFFYFDNQTLTEIMRQLGQWYDTNVVFTDANLMQMRLHFVADRSNSLQDIIDSINKMRIVRLVYKDNTIIVGKHE